MSTNDNSQTIATLCLAAHAAGSDATTMARLDALDTLEQPARHHALAELWEHGYELALSGDWPTIVLAQLDLAGSD